MAGLNIKLKDTQGISNRPRTDNTKKSMAVAMGNIPSKSSQAQKDTILYGGTVRGAGLGQESNDNAILNDRGVQQIASPTQKGRTATQWRAAPSYVADRLGQGTYSGDNRYNQITRPTKLGIEDQIKQNNQDIINPSTPTDEMYQGAYGVKKPTKAEDMRAEIEAKRKEQEQKLRDEQNNLSIIEQTEYLKKSKEQQDYMEQQRALQVEQDKIAEEQNKVQEDTQLKQASDSISRLRQNLGFIGGSNSVSQQALDSAGRQIGNLSKMYADMKQLNELGGRARGVQSESLKNNFNRDMKLLQDDLDTKVDKVIQGAFNGIAAADMSGQLDTIEEVNAMRLKVLDAIDLDVAAVTKGEIQRREMLLGEYTQLLADEKERIKLSNTVNPEMSKMKGYYVDGNGEAFVNASTGLPIPMPVEAPYPPQFLKETGQLLTFGYDENGQIVANVQQVVDMPKEADNERMKLYMSMYNIDPDKANQMFPEFSGGNNSQGQNGNIGTTPSQFINKREGFREQAYWDTNGWAVGYGQHAINGVPVKEGDTIDRATADADLSNRMANAKYNSLINVELSDYQKAALYSLEHNVGGGVWDFPNGKAIIDAINSGDLQKASNILATSGIGTTNATTGEIMNGLVNRRREEAELLMIPKDFDPWVEGADSQQGGINASEFSQHVNYIENGKLPTGMKDNTGTATKFKQEALQGYMYGKEAEYNSVGFTISDPTAFASAVTDSALIKDKNRALQTMPAFNANFDRLIALADEYGTELRPGTVKQEMNQLVKDTQLKAKEIYNLGVLNGPDLSLMEAIISNPTDWTAKFQQIGGFGVNYADSLRNAKNIIMNNAIGAASGIGLSPIQAQQQGTGGTIQQGTGTETLTQEQQAWLDSLE